MRLHHHSSDEGEVKVREDLLLLGREDARCPWQCQNRFEAGELLVEVADVPRCLDDGQERRLNFLGQESVPVHSL